MSIQWSPVFVARPLASLVRSEGFGGVTVERIDADEIAFFGGTNENDAEFGFRKDHDAEDSDLSHLVVGDPLDLDVVAGILHRFGIGIDEVRIATTGSGTPWVDMDALKEAHVRLLATHG